jgi:hypothetical protein
MKYRLAVESSSETARQDRKREMDRLRQAKQRKRIREDNASAEASQLAAHDIIQGEQEAQHHQTQRLSGDTPQSNSDHQQAGRDIIQNKEPSDLTAYHKYLELRLAHENQQETKPRTYINSVGPNTSATQNNYAQITAEKKLTASTNKTTQKQQYKAAQRETTQANDKVADEQRQVQLLAAVEQRYQYQIEYLLTMIRIQELEKEFEDLKAKELKWPAPLPDMKVIYKNFYTEIHKTMHNVVCASCACIGHRPTDFETVPITYQALQLLSIPPDILIRFNFRCGI